MVDSSGKQVTARFNIEQLNRMLAEMDVNNVQFNFQGEPAQRGQPIITRQMITRMIDQLQQGAFS